MGGHLTRVVHVSVGVRYDSGCQLRHGDGIQTVVVLVGVQQSKRVSRLNSRIILGGLMFVVSLARAVRSSLPRLYY